MYNDNPFKDYHKHIHYDFDLTPIAYAIGFVGLIIAAVVLRLS